MQKISIVIAIYNEEENLVELTSRIENTLKSKLPNLDYEIILIDDGSQDNSLKLIKEINKQSPKVKAISFSRNFGHHVALVAGLHAATGDYTVMMDGDLQDRPEEIPRLFKKLEEGYDCVIATRKSRQDTFFKKLLSSIFWNFINFLSDTKIPKNQAMLRIFNKKVLTQLQNLQEKHFMVAGIMSWMGFKQTTIQVEHAPRKHGTTKYNFRKSLLLAINAIVSFSHKPLTIISSIGILFSLFSIILGIYIIYLKLAHNVGIAGWSSLITVTTFIGGLILFAIGIAGIYIGRIYEQSLNRPTYIINEKVE